MALLDMSNHFRSVYDEAVAANSTDMRTGVPLRLDEMEGQMNGAAAANGGDKMDESPEEIPEID